MLAHLPVWVWAIIAVLAIKFLLNLSRFLEAKSLFNDYLRHAQGEGGWSIMEKSHRIATIIQNAGVQDSEVTDVQEIGYGHIQAARFSVLNNVQNRREDVVLLLIGKFHEAFGVYKSRMLETINPVYWLETIIFLPRSFMNYLGVSSQNVMVKILQVVYWILGVAYGVFKPQIDQMILGWVSP